MIKWLINWLITCYYFVLFALLTRPSRSGRNVSALSMKLITSLRYVTTVNTEHGEKTTNLSHHVDRLRERM